MGNILKTFGTPAVTEALREFEERPRREALFQQKQQSFQEQTKAFQQQRAISALRLKQEQMKMREAEEREAELNKYGWNPRKDLEGMNLPKEIIDEELQKITTKGWIDPKTGLGKNKDGIKYYESIQRIPQEFEIFGKRIIGIKEMELEKEINKLTKLTETSSNPVDLEVQQKKVDKMKKNLVDLRDKFQKDTIKSRENYEAEEQMKELWPKPEFKAAFEKMTANYPELAMLIKSSAQKGYWKMARDLLFQTIEHMKKVEMERVKGEIKNTYTPKTPEEIEDIRKVEEIKGEAKAKHQGKTQKEIDEILRIEEGKQKIKRQNQVFAPTVFDKQWAKAEEIAKEKLKRKPTQSEIARTFREEFPRVSEGMMGLFGLGGSPDDPLGIKK